MDKIKEGARPQDRPAKGRKENTMARLDYVVEVFEERAREESSETPRIIETIENWEV